MGGTKTPPADVQTTAVADTPLSADVMRATCLRPLFANILEFLPGTVEIDVSSTLKHLWGGKRVFDQNAF